MRRLLFCSVIVLCAAALAGAQQVQTPNTLIVSATGQAQAAADTALVSFVISGERSGLTDAYQEAQSNAEQLRTLLTSLHFDLDQTQLSSYAVVTHLNPQTRQLQSYEVTTTATLEITDFSRLAPLMNALGNGGIPVLRSVTYTFSLHNLAEAQTQALLLANRNAHDQAVAALAETGRRLGGLLDETVNVPVPSIITVSSGGLGGGDGMAAPTEGWSTRQITVTAHVTATFVLM